MKTITTNLQPHDDEIVRRVAQNLIDYKAGKRRTDAEGVSIYVEYAGVFSVNVEELLEVIERITRPATPLERGDEAEHAAEFKSLDRPEWGEEPWNA